MKIYLAGRYGRRKELLGYAEQLKATGHEITSRWLWMDRDAEDQCPTPAMQREWAREDIEHLRAADVVISFTESGEVPGAARGGRHVEFGIALALGKVNVVVGRTENIFHASALSVPDVPMLLALLGAYNLKSLWERIHGEVVEASR